MNFYYLIDRGSTTIDRTVRVYNLIAAGETFPAKQTLLNTKR